jgi:hypothetical protein
VISKKSIAAPDEFSSMDQTFDDIPIPGRQHVPCLSHFEVRFWHYFDANWNCPKQMFFLYLGMTHPQ